MILSRPGTRPFHPSVELTRVSTATCEFRIESLVHCPRTQGSTCPRIHKIGCTPSPR